jgi:uncharacterized protein (TIGR03083 family)
MTEVERSTVQTRVMDAAAEWEQARRRVVALVSDSDGDATQRRVPACPAWSVRQLLAHMIGLDADVLAGDEPDDHNSRWTQRQVDERESYDLVSLIAEWDALAAAMADYLRTVSVRPLGDVIIHEQDLRGALGKSGARDTDGLSAIRDQMLTRLAGRVRDAGLAPVQLVGDHDFGYSTGGGTPGLVLHASDFDLARAVMSRRSLSQLSGWVTDGDLANYAAVFEVLGPLPETDLTD